MSEKKIVVPEGGLKFALGRVDYALAHSGVEEGIIKRALHDFVRWLADNPIVPTDEEARGIIEPVFADPPFIYGRPGDGMPGSITVTREQMKWPRLSKEQEVFAEWQRRMFLAPELEVKPAKTFTAEEIEHALRESYKGGDYDADWVWRKMQIYLDVAPKPAVPEEIKDLLHPLPLDGSEADPWKRPPADITNQRIIEAYRRGQKAGTK